MQLCYRYWRRSFRSPLKKFTTSSCESRPGWRVDVAEIVSDSQLYDVQPATFAGINNEFVFSPRLDNQLSSCVLAVEV